MESFSLDMIGQLPNLNIYTQLCLCFSVPDGDGADATRQVAADILAQGLETLARRVPWVAGQIVHEPSSEAGNSGTYKIAPWADTPPLVVRDLRGDPSAPTMEALQKRNFPMELLDERLVAPYMTIPGRAAGSQPDEPTAVFAVQMSHVDGGLLLTFVAQHQAMDLAGQMQVMRLLATSCREENLPDGEVELANRDRLSIIPPLGDHELDPVEQLSRQTVKPSPLPSGADSVESVWASFSFSEESLATLKAAALQTATLQNVSTDDALTAFVWQSITRARSRRLRNDPDTTQTRLTLGRAVDCRRYLGVPREYPGLLNTMVYLTHAAQETADMPLGEMASELRAAVDPATSQVGLYTRALTALLRRTPDKGMVSMGADIDPPRDLMLSSWAGAGADCYGLDFFGIGLGPPVAVRRPRFQPFEGLGYLLPRHPSGEIVLAVCLREEDMAALKGDDEFGILVTLRRHIPVIISSPSLTFQDLVTLLGLGEEINGGAMDEFDRSLRAYPCWPLRPMDLDDSSTAGRDGLMNSLALS
ncbi:transferase family-domain-containing protein [Lasiosphaeria miniovina]|uniref:Transferase family-domain-containing protein n=1 Tax=Lasiosphaeria miniovina TaxID=1954250 RepID=A0AA40AKN2_9PEZI|nr:transferase family-domain-containing protein [Lasiosphaeria miniovina]KAK0717569.1 transferase family-domain-containing protein [Lasiosphaeria miniovina]